LEQRFSQPVRVIVEPVAVGDTVVAHFLSDGEHSLSLYLAHTMVRQ